MAAETGTGRDGREDAGLLAARNAFATIRGRFPDLEMVDDTAEVAAASDGAVSLSMTVPVQPGNAYAVHLNLQNLDELHFSVRDFWCEWFPCTGPDCAAQFVEAVSGFLAGSHRLVERYVGAICVKSQLQEPANGGWKAVATWTRPRALLLLLPWVRRDEMVIVNG